jgi:excisionase family DNA binding protein
MGTENMLTAEETSKRLRISRALLSRLVRENRIGHYRIGQRTMFTEEILREFTEATFQPPVKEEREAA